MKFSKEEIENKKDLLVQLGKPHDESIKNIFQWVKQGKIGPREMEELVIYCHKERIY